MKKRLCVLILILCLILSVLPLGSLAATSDHPIRMSAEADPDCSLSGAGTLSYVRFVIKNTGEEDYTLFNPVLSGEVLEEACSLCLEDDAYAAAESVTLEPGTVKEFRIYDVYIPEDALNTDIRFTLSWQEAVYSKEAEPEEEPEEPAEPEDPEEPAEPAEAEEEPPAEPAEPEDPDPFEDEEDEARAYAEETVKETQSVSKAKVLSARSVSYVKRKVSTTIRIETAETPAMELTVKTGSKLVRTDGEVTVTYILSNPTKFDFEDISLYDEAAGGVIELEESELLAGDAVTVEHTFTMGKENAVLNPVATYTERGTTRKTKCASPVTVEYIYDSLTLDVEQYSPTEEGCMFGLTVTNAGTHRMRDITLTDDSDTKLCGSFSLNPGQQRVITYTYGSYTGLQENRRVSFRLSATDSEGETYYYQKPGSFEVRPYVGSGQVSLLLNVTLAEYTEETNTVQLLFEVRNYSDVAISNAVISETAVLGTAVRTYPQLTKGVTTFTMDFSLGEGISVLTFHMEADDAGGTHYATEPVSLAVDRLALAVKNGTFGSANNTVIDTTGTVFDTDKYRTAIQTGLLVLLFAAVLFMLLSGMFRGAEQLVRRDIPAPTPSERITGAGSSVQDTARLRFGYMKPAKLRYAQIEDAEQRNTGERRRTGPLTPTGQPASATRAITGAGAAPSQPRSRTTGEFMKPRKQIKMLTDADTLVFANPVPPRREKAAFITETAKKKPSTEPSDTARLPRVAAATATEASETVRLPRAETKQTAALTKTERVPGAAVVIPAVKSQPAPAKEAKPLAAQKKLTMRACLEAGIPYSFEITPPNAVRPAQNEPEIVHISVSGQA